MSKTCCEHLLQLRPEKVANYFTKAGKHCTGNKKHSEWTILGMCLSCGQVRCDGQENQCTFQHSYGTKHPLIYKIGQNFIYCFQCQQNVGEQLLGMKQGNKKDKLIEMQEKISKYSEKIGEKLDSQQYKVDLKGKKQKKQPIKQHYKIIERQKYEMNQNFKKQEQTHLKLPYKLETFGLKNLGNTCFFNSIIQCLYACEQLHSKYSNFQIDTKREFGRMAEINLMFMKYLKHNEKQFSPKSIFNWVCKTKGAYKHMDQQDAQELLALVVNGLIDGERFWMEIKQSYGEKVTPSEKLFGFFLANRLECLSCEKVSWSVDFSLEIAVQLVRMNTKSITMPQGPIPEEELKGDLTYPPEKLSESFLDTFFAPEAMNSKNFFECEKCGEDKAWRKFYLKDPPEVLTISLKRFNNNLSKNNSVVRPPYRLDLEGHCINKGPLVYQLFAISEHGGTARGGHYVAHTRRGADWYYFSDSSIKSESWQKARSCQPYILFYKRIE